MDMDIINNGQPAGEIVTNGQPSFEGLSQYCPPHCYELAGRTLKLVMDSGYDYEVSFDRERVTWGKVGQTPRTDEYACHKGDDDTFFINLEVAGASPRTGLTLILDDENALVTCLVAHQGTNPKYPYLITLDAQFGAIEIEGKPLNSKRHGYTTELVGKSVEWTYSPDFKIQHVYRSERYYNFTKADEKVLSEKNIQEIERAHLAMAGYDDLTEPAMYIRIKENMYVFAFVEEHMEKLTGPMSRGNSLAFLMNFKRMYDVGRSFGINGQQQPENYCFGAYGRFVDYPEEYKNFKSRYYI